VGARNSKVGSESSSKTHNHYDAKLVSEDAGRGDNDTIGTRKQALKRGPQKGGKQKHLHPPDVVL
jgi:hypothetical protein